MPISGEEWKYECEGNELTPAMAKRLVATKARVLIMCRGAEYPLEVKMMETSPDGDYTKVAQGGMFGMGSQWLSTITIRLLCQLPEQKRHEQPRNLLEDSQ